jgi:predicted aspartyl protease
MKTKPYARRVIRLAAFYFIAAGICQSIQAQTELRFRLVRETFIVVSLMANNEGPFDFVLDTGTDTTIVDARLASKLSLAPLSHIQQATLAGTQTLTVTILANLGAGPGQVGNLPVLVQDLTMLRKMDSHIEGIVGQDFLSHFNYLIDYRRCLVRIEQGDEIRSSLKGDPVSIEVSGHRMIIASEAQSTGRANLRFLLDSGANSIVLLPRASREINLPVQENRSAMSVNGHVDLKVGRIRALKIGSQQFHDLVVALPSTELTPEIGDGLLPTALFKTLYVNNHEGFVMFNPQPRKN